MGMEVCPNGDLYEQIHTRKSLPLEDARAYAAEMVAMLAVLREHSVVFRCGHYLAIHVVMHGVSTGGA